MRSTFTIVAVAAVACLTSSPALAQINFEKTGYYLSLGDSIAAGEGALPVTHGFVYQLYDHGAFGQKQEMDFANIGIKGATSDEVQALQVPQALCIQPPRIGVRPSVITLTAGANDFFVFLASGIPQNPGAAIPLVADAIAGKVANIIRSLVFGIPNLPAHCARTGIPDITVLVGNYYGFNHPDPQIDFLLDLALTSFSAGLQSRLAQIQADIVAFGKTARVGLADTLSAMEGRKGLLLIEKRNGFTGAFEFEIHPTNAGHSVIAQTFEDVWQTVP